MKLILVTGAARSGTSLTVGVLEKAGAFMGDCCGPTVANRKGQWENSLGKEMIKSWLKVHKLDPFGQNPLPFVFDTCRLFKEDPFYKKMVKTSKRLVHQADSFSPEQSILEIKEKVFAIKEAKWMMVWGMMDNIFTTEIPEVDEVLWVCTKRKTKDIVASCYRTKFMAPRRRIKGRDGWVNWVKWHNQVRREMEKRLGDRLLVVSPDAMVKERFEGEHKEAKKMIEFCGLPWNESTEKRIFQWIEPSMWVGKRIDKK